MATSDRPETRGMAGDMAMISAHAVPATRRASHGAIGAVDSGESGAPPEGSGTTKLARPYERYRVSIEAYVTFHRQGFLIVRGLVPPEDVRELVRHSEELMHGEIAVPGLERPRGATPEEMERCYLRIHMLHRVLDVHERFLLHPRVLDVLEALIGPDVMAMQSMFFLRFPGGAGQGYHQDAYYIPTVPDTLCGAWLAVDRADEENGCLWFTPGTQHEPISPRRDARRRTTGRAWATSR